MDQELFQQLIVSENPSINFNGRFIGAEEVELILSVLRSRGCLKIQGTGEIARFLISENQNAPIR